MAVPRHAQVDPAKLISHETQAGRVGMREINHAVAGERLVLADNETFLEPLEDDSTSRKTSQFSSSC